MSKKSNLIPTPKDDQRIEALLAHPHPAWAARTMAKRITNPDKALRRARAASRKGQAHLAEIFFNRHLEL